MAQVDLSIFLGTEKIKIRVSVEVARRISQQIESGRGKWIKIDSGGTNLLLDVAEVKGVRIEKAREYKGPLAGFSIKDLSEVTETDYFHLFRKIKKLPLDKISDRRFACSEKNFSLLGISASQKKQLISRERQRKL